jgi:hypothetical protein
MTFIKVQSDVYYQIKPHKLTDLQESLETMTRHCPYRFSKSAPYSGENSIWAIHCLNFTHQEVYDLLKKSIKIVENTEEYIAHVLKETFGDAKDKDYSIPPGTVRFYAQDLICFFNGKVWRKLK